MDRNEFYFREIVTEDDVNSAFAKAENADHNFAVDNSIFQKADGSNAPLSTPAGTDFNALLGGIVDGLNITNTVTSTVTLSAGTAYDYAGNRINVPTDVNIALATTGVTGIGEGGTPGGVGSISTVPASGQFIWILLQVFFNRLLSDPREDGNSMTVYFDSAESFQFKVKCSSSSATPTIPPGDPGCVIIGAFKINDSGTIFTDDYSTRGDWIRTYAVYTAGSLPIAQKEDGTTSDPNFIAGTIRQAILKLRNTIGLSSTNYTNHINQAAPQDKHAAKNIDFDATSGIPWADGTTPALGSNLGGGLDTNGVQGSINTLISTIAGSTTGFGGTKFLGGASISGSPITLAAGTIRSQLSAILVGLNNHLNATTGAHPATAITATAGVVFTGTDVQAQLTGIDAYINGRITDAVSIAGSRASPIWIYKGASANTTLFGIDHYAFPAGRYFDRNDNWMTQINGVSANGTGQYYGDWAYGLFGGTNPNLIENSGPFPAGNQTILNEYPYGPLLTVGAPGNGANAASVLESFHAITGLVGAPIIMEFAFSISSGLSLPQSGSTFAFGFGDGTLVGSASTAAINGSGANPEGGYIFINSSNSWALQAKTDNGSATFAVSSTILVTNHPHRIRIEIIPAGYSDDGNHHVTYYIDGIEFCDHQVDLTSLRVFPFFRASGASGATEAGQLRVGPLRILARKDSGGSFLF